MWWFIAGGILIAFILGYKWGKKVVITAFRIGTSKVLAFEGSPEHVTFCLARGLPINMAVMHYGTDNQYQFFVAAGCNLIEAQMIASAMVFEHHRKGLGFNTNKGEYNQN